MFAAILMRVPLMLLPVVHVPLPTADCQFDVLSPTAMEDRAIAGFAAAVDHYVNLHRRLERSLPPEGMFDDPEDMFAAREALRFALVDARPTAREGNIFTPGIAEVIRHRLEAAIQEHNYSPREVLAAINEERLPGMPEPEVNGEYPWMIGSTVWPTLLAALPPLPRELEYRFSDRNLVLLDVHANLVVDILPNALPAVAPALAMQR
jgi:hypothetical protein